MTEKSKKCKYWVGLWAGLVLIVLLCAHGLIVILSLADNLRQIVMKQYFNPPDLDAFFGAIEPLKLEDIFNKSKPRYFKRTSSAVWNVPPTQS